MHACMCVKLAQPHGLATPLPESHDTARAALTACLSIRPTPSQWPSLGSGVAPPVASTRADIGSRAASAHSALRRPYACMPPLALSLNEEELRAAWCAYAHLICCPLPAVCPRSRLVLSQNKKELLVNWWNEGKLEPSEEMGDMVGAACMHRAVPPPSPEDPRRLEMVQSDLPRHVHYPSAHTGWMLFYWFG